MGCEHTYGIFTVFCKGRELSLLFRDSKRRENRRVYCVWTTGSELGSDFPAFQWGYLLFAPARGLSFFWCGRFLALLMIFF